MPGAADTLKPNADLGLAKRIAPNADPVQISSPSILPDSEPPYKKLASNFGIVPDLKFQRLEGEARGLSFGFATDLDAHFEILRRDFVGLPLLCYAHAQLIVCVRRKLELSENLAAFLKLWSTESKFLTEHLNSRWLISACDTFADYGSDTQKAAAIIMVILVNTVKLAETERLIFGDPNPMPSKLEAIAEKRNARTHIELWDGVTAYALFSGDMPRNMLRRLATLTEKDVALAAIAKTLIRRAVTADTVLGRLARMNNGFLPSEFA